MGYDHVRRERRQFCCVPANFIGFGRGPARVNLHVAADAPAGLLETLQESAEAGLKFPIVRTRGQENANEAYLLPLLRPRRERPRRRAAEKRDELALFWEERGPPPRPPLRQLPEGQGPPESPRGSWGKP